MARTTWIILDAASDMVVNKLLEKDELPCFKKLLKQGIKSSVELNKYNCQTPCALATQFSGILPEKNQVGGYFTPNFQGTGQAKLYYQITFKNQNVCQNVLWNEKSIRTARIALGQIPYSNLQQSNIKKIDGFSNMIYESQIIYEDEIKFLKQTDLWVGRVTIFDREFQILIDNSCVHKNICLRLLETGNQIFVRCNENVNNDFWLEAAAGFKFFVFTMNSGKMMFLFSNVYQYSVKNIEINDEFRKKVGVFLGVAYGKKYRSGAFGKPYYDKGDGSAEHIYLCLLREVCKTFERMNLFLLELDADIIISYQPVIDEMSHEFFGWWKNSQGDERKFYWNIVKKAYKMADEHVGNVMDCMKDEDNIIITSDHGMYDIDTIFYINEYLHTKGYLNYQKNNEINVEESKLFFHPCNSGALFFNDKIKDRSELLRELSKLMINGRKMVKKILDTSGNKVFGDYFIIPEDKIIFDSKRNGNILEYTNKTGCHMVNNGSKDMHAIFFVKSKYLSKCKINYSIKNTQIKDIVLTIINYS